MYSVYSLLLALAMVVASPFYLWKGRRTGKYRSSFRERMGRLPSGLNPMARESIWIHAVSVGEALAVRPLVKPLRARFPHLAIFVSTTTEAGNAVARKSLPDVDGILFAPFDFRRAVGKALDVLRPRLLLLVETEIWPNLIHEASLRGVSVAVVNGRLSESSFKGYLRVKGLVKKVLGEVRLFLMQGTDHARRIRELGAPAERVRVLGNLKFDAITVPPPPDDLARLLGGPSGRPLWVAGSTMPGEEEMILKALATVRERAGEVGLLIAPRHPERFPLIPPMVEAAGLRLVRRSALGKGALDEGAVVLLDTMGELAQVYSLASVVFVGGSLVATGGHNVLEPAMAGKAVIVGPHMHNFREIAEEFRREEAFVQVSSSDELGPAVAALILDPEHREAIGGRAKALVERNRGAVGLTVDSLAELVA